MELHGQCRHVYLLNELIIFLTRDGQFERHSKKEVQLQLVDFTICDVPNVRPVLVAVVVVLEKLARLHDCDEKEPLEVVGRDADAGIPALQPVEVHETDDHVASRATPILDYARQVRFHRDGCLVAFKSLRE